MQNDPSPNLDDLAIVYNNATNDFEGMYQYSESYRNPNLLHISPMTAVIDDGTSLSINPQDDLIVNTLDLSTFWEVYDGCVTPPPRFNCYNVLYKSNGQYYLLNNLSSASIYMWIDVNGAICVNGGTMSTTQDIPFKLYSLDLTNKTSTLVSSFNISATPRVWTVTDMISDIIPIQINQQSSASSRSINPITTISCIVQGNTSKAVDYSVVNQLEPQYVFAPSQFNVTTENIYNAIAYGNNGPINGTLQQTNNLTAEQIRTRSNLYSDLSTITISNIDNLDGVFSNNIDVAHLPRFI